MNNATECALPIMADKREPITLSDAQQHQIEQELIAVLDRHPEEAPCVDRIRRVMVVRGGEQENGQ